MSSNAFDPEQTERMSHALSEAWSCLIADGGTRGRTDADAKAMLARGILDAAGQGESDINRLVVSALAYYRQIGNPDPSIVPAT